MRAKKEGIALTHLKLQKLVYILHGWHLAKFGKPLIDEAPQAWKYGPVIKSLYHALKIHASLRITRPIELRRSGVFEIPYIPEKYAQTLDYLNTVWDAYKHATAAQLIEVTHKDGTPWHGVYRPNAENLAISDNAIQAYYRNL